MTTPAVILYKDRNYAGTAVELKVGDRFEDIAAATGMPRGAVSSIRVAPFVAVTLWSDRVYGGKSMRIAGPIDIPDLGRYAGGFNDKTASVIVESTATDAQLLKCCKTPGATGCGDYTYGSPACSRIVGDHCVKNVGDSFCQQWCRNNTEKCDAAVIAWCEKNPGDPYCSCIKSKAGKIANPKCVDAKCVRYGYLTTNMERTACPNVIDCSVRAKLINSGVSLATVVPIEQNCGGDANTSTKVTSSGTGSGVTAAPGISPVVLVMALIFIIIITVALTMFLLGGDDDARARVIVSA